MNVLLVFVAIACLGLKENIPVGLSKNFLIKQM